MKKGFIICIFLMLITLSLILYGCNSKQVSSDNEVSNNCIHEIVIDQAIEVTYEQNGYTEGSHCSKCGETIIPQTMIPKLPKNIVNFIIDENKGTLIGETHQELKENEQSSSVYVQVKPGYRFIQWSNGITDRTISITTTQNIDITAIIKKEENPYPIISINTENNMPITSKDNWVNCQISTSLTNDKYILDDEPATIKGRGNSTWGMPKKPYKFKFSSKQNLFGLGKAKKWVLLANYDDPSAIRNELAYTVGKSLDEIKDDTVDSMFVELILNGEYCGLYQLCEQIEINSNRVDICDDTSVVDTGYLIEIDFRGVNAGIENTDYIIILGTCYSIHEPDPEDDLTSEQVTFIKNYVTAAINALTSGDYQQVLNYFDVNTFAATYIVQELFKSVDVGCASFWMYKDAGGKLCCGPIWDFDISVGNCNYVPTAINPNYLYAAENNLYYNNLLKYDEFNQLVSTILHNNEAKIKDAVEVVIEDALNHSDAYFRNFDLWKTIGVYVWPNSQDIVDIKSWEGNIEYIKKWLDDSLKNLLSVYKTTA